MPAAFVRTFVLFCLLATAARADDALPPTVAAALAKAGIPESAVSLEIQPVLAAGGAVDALVPNAERGKRPVRTAALVSPLLAVNPDRAVNPASTMKLVTTYAALEMLGPAATWKTVAASNAPLVGDTLEGDLVLRGSGDPRFVVENLWLMLRQLRGRGIRTIRGDLVVDRTAFQPVAFDPAAFDNEPYRPYNVGPDALLVNFKAVSLRFVPDDARREIRVVAEPLLADFAIGAPVYADGPCGDWRAKAQPDFGRTDGIAFLGTYAASCGEQTWNVSVLDPVRYAGALFRSLWTELGGTLRGTVRDGTMPPDAKVLVERESASVAELIRDINKYSNNVMARMLFLALSGTPATAEQAQRNIRDFYQAKGMAMPELVLENGSGLSRRERISVHSMLGVLQAAWISPVMPEFVASLPLVGYDGTMRRRLTAKTVAGQAHVKTGTLQDVRAVAGYVQATSGRRYAMAFVVNHPNAAAAQAAQDALLQWIYDRG